MRTRTPSQSPTLTARATQAGVILGTAAYMAPEQARGKPVDRRADIWAFGAVLYEMLTGQRAFVGSDATETLAAVIRAAPEWSALPDDLPPRLREVVERCLEKDPRRRARDIGDVRLDLERVVSHRGEGRDAPSGTTATNLTSALGWSLVAFALGGVMVGGSVKILSPPEPTPPRPVRFSFEVPGTSLQVGPVWVGRLALSPDGSTVAYVGPPDTSADTTAPASARQLYLRRVDEPEGGPLPGTDGAQGPFFSPDGEWVGFVARGKMQRVPVAGGSPLEICSVPPTVFGASWGPDGRIVFGGGIGSGLMGVAVTGGEPTPLTSPDLGKGEVLHGYPDTLPDGRTVLFTVGTGQGSRLARLSVETGEWKEILPSGANPRYLHGDHLVFSEEGRLRLTRLEANGTGVTGPILPVVDGIRWASAAGLEETFFAVSRGGDLAFVPEGLPPVNQPVWVDRTGAESAIGVGPGFHFGVSLSPDGRRIATSRAGDGFVGKIWLMKADGSRAVPVAAEGSNYNEVWTPDGRMLTFTSNGDIYEIEVDRDAGPSPVLARDGYLFSQSWSRDGQHLAFMESSLGGLRLWVLPRDGEPKPLLDSSFNSGSAHFHPRADVIAYASDQSGREEVYVRPFPSAERATRVSRDGGRSPVWSRDGRELFFRRGYQMLAVKITTEPRLEVGRPVTLWEAPYYFQEGLWSNYDVAADGRFLMLTLPDASGAGPDLIHVHLDWLAQVEGTGQDE